MKWLLFVLTLIGCSGTQPITYSLVPSIYTGNYHLTVVGSDMTTIRNRAFIIADETCKYSHQNWTMISIAEDSQKHIVSLHFECYR
jgi:hypothetical protein